MKSRRQFLVFAAAAMVAISTAAAQPAPKPKILIAPPPGPLVWTIRYTYASAAKKPEASKSADASIALDASDLARPLRADFVIAKPVSTKKVRYEGDVKKEDAFYYGNFEFRASADGKEILTTNLDSYPTAEQLFRTQFPGVAWVTPALFVKVADSQGQPCAWFRDDNPAKADLNASKMDDVIDPSKYEVREAWFSLATGLPVAFKAGGMTGVYAFDPQPAPPTTIPADVRAKIAQQVKYQEYLKARAAGN